MRGLITRRTSCNASDDDAVRLLFTWSHSEISEPFSGSSDGIKPLSRPEARLPRHKVRTNTHASTYAFPSAASWTILILRSWPGSPCRRRRRDLVRAIAKLDGSYKKAPAFAGASNSAILPPQGAEGGSRSRPRVPRGAWELANGACVPKFG
jgi:hypothetical protein